MQIIPAIDLINGECVRLFKGDYGKKTVYEKNPLNVVSSFVLSGAGWLHIVDLDGAKDIKFRQTPLLKEIALKNPSLKIEVGGGIREEHDIKDLLDAGVTRIIIGSLCANDPLKVKDFIKIFGEDKIVLGIDVRIKNKIPYALTSGWQKDSDKTLFDLLDFYLDFTTSPVLLCTDISKDGAMEGPSLDLYKEIKQKYQKLQLIASGGVSKLDDLHELFKIGSEYAITGKALYENKINLKDALEIFDKLS